MRVRVRVRVRVKVRVRVLGLGSLLRCWSLVLVLVCRLCLSVSLLVFCLRLKSLS